MQWVITISELLVTVGLGIMSFLLQDDVDRIFIGWIVIGCFTGAIMLGASLMVVEVFKTCRRGWKKIREKCGKKDDAAKSKIQQITPESPSKPRLDPIAVNDTLVEESIST